MTKNMNVTIEKRSRDLDISSVESISLLACARPRLFAGDHNGEDFHHYITGDDIPHRYPVIGFGIVKMKHFMCQYECIEFISKLIQILFR